jgi:aquaporin Z
MSDASTSDRRWRVLPAYAYLPEAVLPAVAISAAAGFSVLMLHPDSLVAEAIPSLLARRAMAALGTGLVGLLLVLSPLGRLTGPHLNPAVTLSFLRLGRIRPGDALLFILAQFAGAAAGLFAVDTLLLGRWLRHEAIHQLTTMPGPYGAAIAWAAEAAMAFAVMNVVLTANRHPRVMRWTPVLTMSLVWVFALIESPLSGASLSPSRTTSAALVAGRWAGWWVYYTAPVLGMLAAVELHRLVRRDRDRICGKLVHGEQCVFKCRCGEPAADAGR